MSKPNKFMIVQRQSVPWSDVVKFHSDLKKIMDSKSKLSECAAELDNARAAIYATLPLADSKSWTDHLTRLQTMYNANFPPYQRALQQTAIDFPTGATMFEQIINDAIQEAAAVNTALNEAISAGDASALWSLYDKESYSFIEILNQHVASFDTSFEALNRRFGRAKVYIGKRCYEMEKAGETNIRRMWQAIYSDLQSRQRRLTLDDEKEAWTWLKGREPMGLWGDKRRMFEQEISDMKRDMTTHIEGANSRQSSDKTD